MELETSCEVAWAQIKLPNTQQLNIASIYRPPNSSANYMIDLHSHLTKVYSKYRRATYIIGGDFNLPDISWEPVDNTHIPTTRTDSAIHTTFINILDDLGLSQHCLDVTRPASGNILDLILTNKPRMVTEVTSLP